MSARRTYDGFMADLFDLFRQNGVSDLTVGEIARRLSCSRSRLYAVAETKEELFLVVAKRHLAGLLEESDAIIALDVDVVKAITLYLDLGVRASALLHVPFLRDLDATRAGRRIFDTYQAKRGMGLAQLVERGVQTGVFQPRNASLVAEILLGGALRIRRARFLARSGLTLEEAFSEFYALLLCGLMKPGADAGLEPMRCWKTAVAPSTGAPEVSEVDEAPSQDGGDLDITDLLLQASIRH